MKTYAVTFREWMYQEKTMIVDAESKEEAVTKADEEMYCTSDKNKHAEWYGSEFKTLKPKVRIKRGE